MKYLQPKLPAGFCDYGPQEMYEREYIINILKKNFCKYHFEQISTPAIENLNILNKKYGEEGNKLIYKILKSGNFLKNTNISDENFDSKIFLSELTKKGLRYDLTVPLSRYISKNRSKHDFPFKRYQIQPVWRADRPQKGRYREFYQCDADILGVKSLISEAEILVMIAEILRELQIDKFKIKVNHRNILNAITEGSDDIGKEQILANHLDKVHKIGLEQVIEALSLSKISSKTCEKINNILIFNDKEFDSVLANLENILKNSKICNEFTQEIKELLLNTTLLGMESRYLEFDPSIVRGLDYYTGIVFEIIVDDVNIGSIGGGGRYENLTKMFSSEPIPGFGFSFGLERLHFVLQKLKKTPKFVMSNAKLLVTNFDNNVKNNLLRLSKKLRSHNLSLEIYPKILPLKKQLSYANKKNIPFVLIYGEQEMKNNIFIIKNMSTGDQKKFQFDDISQFIAYINNIN